MSTHMRREIDEIPQSVQRLLDHSGQSLRQAGKALADHDPEFLVTVARGSSDHAASFLKYAIELVAHRAVASLGPSLASIYDVTLRLDRAAAIAISQSGKSPDIVAMAKSATESGALSIALTNTLPSPIAQVSRFGIDIQAGPELAVAATKSCVNSIVAGLAILAEWTGDKALHKAINDLPEHLAKATTMSWDALGTQLDQAQSLYMLGRGPALAIANEAALKFKETSGMHAEAFSSAEVLHGPVALVGPRFPVVVLAARDRAEDSVVAMADNLAAGGSVVSVTSDKAKTATRLPFVATGHPITDALALIVPFYGFVEAWSRSRGLDPDAPVALKKVTETR